MNIDELFEMVDTDLGKPLRRDMTDWEASRLPSLLVKYRKILYYEKLELERMKSAMMPLLRFKKEYYGGKCDLEVYKKHPFDLKLEGKTTKIKVKDGINVPEIIKDEITMYVEADPDVIKAKELVTAQLEKVEFVKDQTNEISKRSYSISNIINTQRFKAGLDKLGDHIDLSEPED
jgi:hypothetical protein